jgi:hypothetical protein
MRRAASAIVVGLLAFGGATLAALEGGEVVVVETTAPDGAPRRTRTWIAEDDAGTWIEAANPARPFLLDVRRGSPLVLERGGVRRACTAEIAPDPEGHERIRRLLAGRYGWADHWVALLADTRESLAVRLECAP